MITFSCCSMASVVDGHLDKYEDPSSTSSSMMLGLLSLRLRQIFRHSLMADFSSRVVDDDAERLHEEKIAMVMVDSVNVVV